MSTKNSCPCPTGDVAVTSTVTSPFSRTSKLTRLLLSFVLVFGTVLFANAPAFAQTHTTGLNTTKTISPDTPVVQGTSVTVTVTVENQDVAHGVKNFAVTNTVPFPGGTPAAVTCDKTSLTASDGVPGSGGDFATCTFQELVPITCNTTNDFLTDQVNSSGLDDAPGTIFDNLPVSGSATNTVVGTPLNCNDNNACTTDTCTPGVGCSNTPITCNDNSACTTDTCDPASGCVFTPITCNDNSACTTDTCDPASGCVFTPITCNDNSACTTDTCDPASGCVFTPITCNDNSACTTDTCDPATGCVFTPITCNDNDTCTDDTCDPASGCVFTDNGTCNGEQGCTPGFWKNNASKKGGNAWPPVALNTTLSGAGFVIPGCLSTCQNFNGNTTLLAALGLQGGNDACGKAEILLRAAAAAYLNASSSCVEYPINPATVVSEVNTALASCDGATIIAEATRLDGFNNAGCPINQQGQCSNPTAAPIVNQSISAPKTP